MTKRTVAAELVDAVHAEAVTYPNGHWATAEKQLRALLAVARCADAERRSLGNIHVDACRCPLCRALSRLTTPKRAARGKR